MKMKTLLIGMFLLAGTANVFAGTNAKAAEAKKLIKTETVKVSERKRAEKDLLGESTCKVSVSFGKTTVTITVTCECTQVQACDAAYKIATIPIR